MIFSEKVLTRPKLSGIIMNVASDTPNVRYAAMAQQVEHVLGKDEVTGSNPVSSSKVKAPPFKVELLVIYLYFRAASSLE